MPISAFCCTRNHIPLNWPTLPTDGQTSRKICVSCIGISRYKLYFVGIADRGQTDRVTTHTRAGLRYCRWLRPRHDAPVAVLACSWWRDDKRTIKAVSHYSVLTLTLIIDLDPWPWLSIIGELGSWYMDTQKITFKCQSVQKTVETRQTEGRTLQISLSCSNSYITLVMMHVSDFRCFSNSKSYGSTQWRF